MVETEFVVRRSGRREYFTAFVAAVVVSFILFSLNNWMELPLHALIFLVWVLAGASGVISFIKAKIQYIDVDTEGITLHKGLFNKKTTYVPYERITNINVDHNLIDRVFMLGTLKVDTAGTTKTEITMGSIPNKYLEKMSGCISGYIGKKRHE
ncbi:PH domain-containing protein [Candidatus Micrarchaeota archaeon]|nr:PH domain-containing protein [Candidatus Micrarchaeota archaeon]